jgi:hypothetical protein
VLSDLNNTAGQHLLLIVEFLIESIQELPSKSMVAIFECIQIKEIIKMLLVLGSLPKVLY